jgi:hypothetical protein
MVDKFETILQKIEQARGAVSLFALLKMDEFVDKWTVILSAPWTIPENRDAIFEEVRNLIITDLNTDELNEVSRLAIYGIEEHIVDELLNYQSSARINEPTKINGNMVHQAIIIKSQRPAGN